MAFGHGKDSVFKVDNAAGTITDITTFLTSVEGLPAMEKDMADTSTMGTQDRTFIPGQRQGTFTINGRWDGTATTGPDAILQGIAALNTTASSTFEYGPEGSGAGKVKYTGEAFCQSYTTSDPYDGVVMFSATFRRTGAVTKTTWP